MKRKRAILQASQTRIDVAVTVISERDGGVTVNIMSLINLTFILMLFWYTLTAVNYFNFHLSLWAMNTQQAMGKLFIECQILVNSFAFGVGLIS